MFSLRNGEVTVRVGWGEGSDPDSSTGEDGGSPAPAGTHGLQFRLRDVGGERESAGSGS